MSQHRFPSVDPEILTQWRSSLDLAFREFVQTHGDTIENIFSPLLQYLLWSEDIFMNSPWYFVLFGILAVTWLASRSLKVVLITATILCLIGWIGLWSVTMQTISLVVASVAIIFLLGIVVGIAMSQSNILERAITPVLDIMQTMPSYVYLIPVVMILGLGRTAGVIAIVVFSIPPVIRFVNLGIRQIDQSLIDAADAFGCSRWKKIFYVQLPLAMPTVMAGVNQSVMLALSIVVIAAMIGVPGLGQPVLQAITAQYFTMGLLNGLAIVGLAVIFDKVTQSYGLRLQKHLDHKK
jgi:glycine betaine/proline transport system permease protein